VNQVPDAVGDGAVNEDGSCTRCWNYALEAIIKMLLL
jgi:hypothetical protein